MRYYNSEFKIAITIVITFILLLIVILAMGGGHGTYVPAKVVYPYSMLISILINNEIGTLSIIIAIIQVPIYSLFFVKKPKWKFYVIGIHAIAAITCLNLSSQF